MKTLRCIFTDLKRVLTSPYFFAGIAIMAAVCCTMYVYTGDNGKAYNVIEAFIKLRGKRLPELSAQNICCRYIDNYGLMFMGMIASFPFIFIRCGEQKNGLRFSVCRTGVFNYSVSGTVSAVVSAGLVCGLGFLLFSGIVFILFPSGEFTSYVADASFARRFADCVSGAALSGMSVSFLPLFISAFTSNKYFCVCIPFLADYLRMTLANKILMNADRNTADAGFYDRVSLLYPDYMARVTVSRNAACLAIFAGSLLISFAAVYFARKGRVDIGA